MASTHAFSQHATLKEMEQDLLRTSGKLFSFYGTDEDSLAEQSEVFATKLIKYVTANPSTLEYSFKALKDTNACWIATSADGLFRIYSWDTWTGGTMHVFDKLYQWKAGGKVHSLHIKPGEQSAGSFYGEMFTVTEKNKTWYFAVGNSIFSNKDARQSIQTFTIENGLINDSVKMFKTKKEFLNEINVDFDFFSVVDHPERPVRLIKYDPVKRIIYIPVVGDNGKVSNRFILYQFNGKYFEHIVTQKPE